MTPRLLRPVALLALAVVVGGCGVGTDEDARPIDDDEVPFGLIDAPDEAPEPAVASARGCFFLEDQLVVADLAGPVDDLRGLVEALEEPPPGFDTAVPEADIVVDASTEEGAATVDLGADFADVGSSGQRRSVAQVVCAITEQPGIESVTFSVDGTGIEVPTGDGTLAGTVDRSDYAEIIVGVEP